MTNTVWREEDVPPDAAAWVMTSEGRGWLDVVLAGDDTDEDTLAVGARLRKGGLAPEQAATVQAVAAASRRAWAAGHGEGTWWTPAAAEQASHPVVAGWRARRYAGAPAVDLTAGCGGDTRALAGVADEVVAAELSPVRLAFLQVNVTGLAHVVRADATRPCVDVASTWAWADPGRRSAGRRVRSLAEVSPPVPVLAASGWAGLGVAVSPAVDLADPVRPADAELEFVQVGRQLVEATVWSGHAQDTGPGPPASTSATLLPSGEHRRGDPSPPGPAGAFGAWLAEPEPALVRARLVDELAEELGLHRVARRRALFTGDRAVTSPWFRLEAIEAVVAARPARVRDVLAGLPEEPVELLTHGMSVDVGGWWRGLGGPPRGPQGRAVHLVRLDRGSVAVVTRR